MISDADVQEALNRVREFREGIPLKSGQRAIATLISARVVSACREAMLVGLLSCDTQDDCFAAINAGLAMGIKSFQDAQSAGRRANPPTP